MRLSEIESDLGRSMDCATRYRFTVFADGCEVLTDVEMFWNLTPRAALPKFAAMMQRKYRGRTVDISMDWG